MYEHWSAESSLAEIARIANLTPYHFHRSFREAIGQPPMRWWLRRLKIQKAKEALTTQQKTVTEVAFNCGFADVFSFSKALPVKVVFASEMVSKRRVG